MSADNIPEYVNPEWTRYHANRVQRLQRISGSLKNTNFAPDEQYLHITKRVSETEAEVILSLRIEDLRRGINRCLGTSRRDLISQTQPDGEGGVDYVLVPVRGELKIAIDPLARALVRRLFYGEERPDDSPH